MNTMRGPGDQQSRVFCELSALVFNLLRSPPLMPDSPPRRSTAGAQITPAGFASLLLGISVALMLCGSVTFFIGFMLMPWVLGLMMVFYVAAIVSALSVLGRSILCFASPRKDLPDFSAFTVEFGRRKMRFFEVQILWELLEE
ncbi:uncharacterized protein LOC106762821 isoform X1 [Vigna radiata var. radiata]|uniref:Uncharacterized protein LOC106762821 isoform X1 n=1 Tax=Vigna radiata var. radiata TaxID=3916 RepID=A0A3Q0F2E7_VIGRR|nr:uncharacterized protein LOC106762821 isoform X1 [Vigna radiata var. radiata]XP_022636597.1 uncharacterized protein LOC106762821 isoform X1 [Vigna radiata var. radiata]